MAKKRPKLAGTINVYTPTLPQYANLVRRGAVETTPSGRICVVGRGFSGSGDLINVWAKVYHKETDVESSPPGDASSGSVLVDGFFAFVDGNEVPGAKCKCDGVAKNNWLAVWAEFPDGINPPYVRRFHGTCNNDHCECDRPDTLIFKPAKKKSAKGAKKATKKKRG